VGEVAQHRRRGRNKGEVQRWWLTGGREEALGQDRQLGVACSGSLVQRLMACTCARGAVRQQRLGSYMKGTRGGVLSVRQRRVLSWTGMGRGGGHAAGGRVPTHGAYSARRARQRPRWLAFGRGSLANRACCARASSPRVGAKTWLAQ
jgi:hypothetical protein